MKCEMKNFQVENIRSSCQGYCGFEPQQSENSLNRNSFASLSFRRLPKDLLNAQNLHENPSKRIP